MSFSEIKSSLGYDSEEKKDLFEIIKMLDEQVKNQDARITKIEEELLGRWSKQGKELLKKRKEGT